MLPSLPGMRHGGVHMKRLVDPWLNHPSADWSLCFLLALVGRELHPKSLIDEPSRAAAYQTFVGVSGVLLTVGLIVVTLVFTVTPTPRLEAVLATVGPRLRHLVTSCISGLIISTIGAAALYLFKSDHQRIRDFLTILLFALMAFRFGRLWWLIGRIMDVLLPAKFTSQVDAPSWTRPEVGQDDYQEPLREG